MAVFVVVVVVVAVVGCVVGTVVVLVVHVVAVVHSLVAAAAASACFGSYCLEDNKKMKTSVKIMKQIHSQLHHLFISSHNLNSLQNRLFSYTDPEFHSKICPNQDPPLCCSASFSKIYPPASHCPLESS